MDELKKYLKELVDEGVIHWDVYHDVMFFAKKAVKENEKS